MQLDYPGNRAATGHCPEERRLRPDSQCQVGHIAPMQALHAIYNAVLCYGPFVLVGWVAKRYLDGWAASLGRHPSEVQGRSGSDRHQRRFLLGAWHK